MPEVTSQHDRPVRLVEIQDKADESPVKFSALDDVFLGVRRVALGPSR